MGIVQELKEKALNSGKISGEEALLLAEAPLEELAEAAEEIRRKKCGQGFDLCTIVNGKCGRCSEDCKYCAQSAHYHARCTEAYDLLSTEKLLEGARHNQAKGVLRYSIVTSGRKLSDREVEQVCESIRAIREETGIQVCVSFGLLEEVQFRKIREAGASRVHCNLESSAGF
ncbi:MAG: radical SAM protein, partial [Lachnospiraceae bacterium]|nr:radical SAM protein [Lachnospiraceae bacterium]